MGALWKTKKILINYRAQLILVITPLLLLPLILIEDSVFNARCKPDCEDCVKKNDSSGDYDLFNGEPYKIVEQKPYKCLFSLAIMATYWTAEVTPLAVTSLMPMFLFPMFGLLPAGRVAAHYFKDINFLFFGGLVVAIAIEKCNLHLRIALSVMKIAGAKLHTMMGAFMAVTAFLSMWISNTATTAMMLPIAVATVKTITGEGAEEDTSTSQNSDPEADQMEMVCGSPVSSGNHLHDGFDGPLLKSSDSLKVSNPKHMALTRVTSYESNPSSMDSSADHILIPDQSFQTVCGDADQSYQQLVSRKIVRKKKSKENSKLLMKAMLLSVAYSANIGGIGTLIGTPVNLILVDQIKTVFGGTEHGATAGEEINFLTWMIFAVPVSIVANFLCWLWLLTVYVGVGKVWNDMRSKEMTPEDEKVTRVIHQRYDALGKMSYTEAVVLVHFITLALLWFTRNPKFIAGWQAGFEPGHVKDSTAALLVCFSLFIFPSKPNFIRWVTGRRAELDQNNMPKPAATILQWKEVQHKLAWDVIILLGAGFALADACTSSGLSNILGEQIASLMASLPVSLLPFVISLMISFITGFTSNTSTASVFLPILMSVCVNMNINPLYLCIPVTMACSFAFILPIATPPNAIAFSYGALETIDMIKVGTLLNCLCVAVTAAILPFIGMQVYNLDTYPDWAKTDEWHNIYSNASAAITDAVTDAAINVTVDF